MGKVEVMSLYLPVVAMGLIPHIYQRAGLALGYPYSGCHTSWDNIACFTILIFALAELLQCQEPELQAEVVYADFPVVLIVLSLFLHGSQAHPRPRVQFLKEPSGGCERLRKVVGCSPDHPVQRINHGWFEVVRALGYFPDFVLKFTSRFVTHGS